MSLKILLIAGGCANGHSCQRILSPAGYDVHCYADPVTGFQAAMAGGFDVILVCRATQTLDTADIPPQDQGGQAAGARGGSRPQRQYRGRRGGDEGGGRRLPGKRLLHR